MSEITDIVLPHPTILTMDSTKLSAWESCPRRFLFEYVLGWRPQSTSIHLTFGVAWHLAMDHLLQHGTTPEQVDLAYQKFHAAWRADVPEHMDSAYEPKDPANAYDALRLYAQTYQLERFKVLHAEIPGVITLGDGDAWERELYVNIDKVIQYTDTGLLAVLDHKTTTADSRQWREGFSLAIPTGAYVHALYGLVDPSQVFGMVIDGVILRKPKTARGAGTGFARIEIQRTVDQQQAWLDEVVYYYKELENHIDQLFSGDHHNQDGLSLFPRRTGSCTKYGTLCPYHGYCVSVRNPLHLAEQHPPTEAPPGFTKEYWNPATHHGERLDADANVDNLCGDAQR